MQFSEVVLIAYCVSVLSYHLTLAAPTSSSNFVDQCAGQPVAEKSKYEWGSYTSITEDQKKLFFNTIYNQIPEGTTGCKATSEFQLSRHYTSLWDEDMQIFSYYCAQSDSRGYEHIKAHMTPGEEKFVQWSSKLDTFGIGDAKGFSHSTVSKEADQKSYAQPIFDLVKDQIPQNVCPSPGTQTGFYLEEKDENHLHYWKFPVSCGQKAQSKIEIEVMQDIEGCFVNGGKVTLVYHPESSIGNQLFMERNEPQMEGQSGHGNNLIPSFSCFSITILTILLPVFR